MSSPTTPTARSSGSRQQRPPTLYQRQSSTLHYRTFPLAPPRNAGKDPSNTDTMKDGNGSSQRTDSETAESSSRRHRRSGSGSSGKNRNGQQQEETPLPKGQLLVLAIIALAEQTALNSISPYLPEMASTFPEVEPANVGMYVGLIASAFALAQFLTNFAWGWLSDRIGRKPILISGTFLTACCFVAFGFCRTLWQAIIVQALIGLVNGNQGVVSTCLGEITDRSNQSRAFTYLPVIYGLGGITGPIVGGLLVMKQNPFQPDKPNPYPYLLPNLFAAGILVIDLIILSIFLKESLESAQNLPPLGKRVGSLFAWIWQFSSSHDPTYVKRGPKPKQNGSQSYQSIPNGAAHGHNQSEDPEEEDDGDDGDSDDDDENDANESSPLIFAGNPNDHISKKHVLNRDTILLLGTFLIFQLANISYNSLYPIFAQANAPIGRDLNPEEIGISLAFAGAVTIIFQVGIFGRLRERIGNKVTYRAGLGAFVVAFLLIPFVGYKQGSNPDVKGTFWDSTPLLWVELAGVLIIKTVAAVGGLTSALLLITNSAPSHAVLGTLNGLAQTLSAAGRAAGPFVSGSLFTASTKVKGKGEVLAFGVFGGISFVGFLLSFGIRAASLEAEGGDEEDDVEGGGAVDDDDDEDDDEDDRDAEAEGRAGGSSR